VGDGRRRLVYYPRAQRDLGSLEARFARQVLEDLPILETPPWPAGKVKRLRGSSFWEIRTGDFRTIFLPEGDDVIVLRVVNRRDLERALGGIDRAAVERWLGEEGPRRGRRARGAAACAPKLARRGGPVSGPRREAAAASPRRRETAKAQDVMRAAVASAQEALDRPLSTKPLNPPPGEAPSLHAAGPQPPRQAGPPARPSFAKATEGRALRSSEGAK
jgi:mRNA-degrading endonuclease RelE of RelBE toxin-antitoxin system